MTPTRLRRPWLIYDSKGTGWALFDYLQAVVNDDSAVIRSGRTLGYYRDLLAICQRHLRSLQNDYGAVSRG